MIGPYEVPLKFVWTNGAQSSLESFSLDQYWSIECSSLKIPILLENFNLD